MDLKKSVSGVGKFIKKHFKSGLKYFAITFGVIVFLGLGFVTEQRYWFGSIFSEALNLLKWIVILVFIKHYFSDWFTKK